MFEIEGKIRGKLGRAGRLTTARGSIETPAFVAVGTKATVKALSPEQIKATGVQMVLGNTYHLYLAPGEKIIEEAGGIGKFMGWDGPTMTDSGGFQVFSLGADFNKRAGKLGQTSVILATPTPHPSGAPLGQGSGGIQRKKLDPRLRGDDPRGGALASIDEDGVTFKSYKDGSAHRFTPEKSIEIQHAIGADIIFAFDECTSPTAPYEYQKEAMERTHRWAVRSLQRHRNLLQGSTLDREKGRTLNSPALFGIVQGGRFEDLRKESARVISKTGFDGFGIGGSFDKNDMDAAVRFVNEVLPEEKPRHLLGIGEPEDLFGAIENGCDLFDCVAPTRLARTGSLYAKHGRFNIENSKYKTDFTPVEQGCGCYACKNFTRAYLSHLFRSNEILANTLATIHNVHFIVQLVAGMRQSILNGTFSQFRESFLATYRN